MCVTFAHRPRRLNLCGSLRTHTPRKRPRQRGLQTQHSPGVPPHPSHGVAAFFLCHDSPAMVRDFFRLNEILKFASRIENHEPITVGKYRIAACPRQLDDGRYAAQVSIASGHGRSCTDRVMRFIPDFPSHYEASRYAIQQGLNWVLDTTAQTH